MILLTSIVFFFFIFFLGLSISNIVKSQETELRSKIEDLGYKIEDTDGGPKVSK